MLVIPDPDHPTCRVVCEACTQQRAEELVEEYRHIVEELQRR
jgi:phosphomannomutase